MPTARIQQELLPSSDPTDVDPVPVGQTLVRSNEQIMMTGMGQTLVGSCPDCNSQLEFSEGCVKCHVCVVHSCG